LSSRLIIHTVKNCLLFSLHNKPIAIKIFKKLKKKVFTIGGYSNRGNRLFDINRNQDGDPILSEGKNGKLTFTAIGNVFNFYSNLQTNLRSGFFAVLFILFDCDIY
jgi:hypothetical protein